MGYVDKFDTTCYTFIVKIMKRSRSSRGSVCSHNGSPKAVKKEVPLHRRRNRGALRLPTGRDGNHTWEFHDIQYNFNDNDDDIIDDNNALEASSHLYDNINLNFSDNVPYISPNADINNCINNNYNNLNNPVENVNHCNKPLQKTEAKKDTREEGIIYSEFVNCQKYSADVNNIVNFQSVVMKIGTIARDNFIVKNQIIDHSNTENEVNQHNKVELYKMDLNYLCN